MRSPRFLIKPLTSGTKRERRGGRTSQVEDLKTERNRLLAGVLCAALQIFTPYFSPSLSPSPSLSVSLRSQRLSDRHSRNVRNTRRAVKVTAEFPLHPPPVQKRKKFLLLLKTPLARKNPAATRPLRGAGAQLTDTGAPSVRSPTHTSRSSSSKRERGREGELRTQTRAGM